MLDIAFIRENPKDVQKAAKHKKVDIDISELLKLDAARKEILLKVEGLRTERNVASKAQDIEKGKEVKQALNEAEAALKTADEELEPLLKLVPNIPSKDTPVGKDESDNKIIRTVGKPAKFDFTPKDHMELGALHNFIDTEKSAEVSGARFSYLKGDIVLLQNALAQYVIAILTNGGSLEQIRDKAGLEVSAAPFTPVIPPLFIRPDVYEKMARLEPKEDRYYIPSDDLYLIGSAEHTLGPIHMGETLRENDLPLRYFAYTPAFRREAGTYGKDTKGILRVHQFDKIEMESFCLPENSIAEQDFFVAIQEHILQGLNIPYQVMQICTGDMGAPDARQIDMECWMPGQDKYRETHTADLMTDYQARRLKTKVKRNTGKSEFVHMNDATAVAMSRMLIAILENYQMEDGRIAVPEILVPYMGGKTIIGETKQD